MSNFDNDALEIFFDLDKTIFERREALQRLLKKENVQAEYMQAMASYVRQTREATTANEAEEVFDEIMSGDEMKAIEKIILTIILSLLYGGGPKDYLVPVSYLPSPTQNPAYR